MSNTTAIAWKGEPDYRGTFNIISACLSTLLISVSTVDVETNKGKSWRKAVLRRIRWLPVCLFAPELILFIAFFQRLAAVALFRKVIRTGQFPPRAPWHRRLIVACKDAKSTIEHMVCMQ